MAITPARGVRATHEDYDTFHPSWVKCSDVIEGGNRVLKNKSTEYLPPYYEEDDQSYAIRLKNTVLVNFAYRTMIGYRGMLQRREAVVKVPPSVQPMLDNISLSGVSLKALIGEVIEEVLTTGRIGLWVNFPSAGSAATLADALNLNLRPSMHPVEPEAITNWATRKVDNKEVLSLVVIKEEHSELVDEFSATESDQYRVLDLLDVPDPLTGLPTPVYRVRVMEHDDEKDVDVTLEEYFPRLGGKPLDYIPFYFISADCTGPDVDEAPLIDLVELNLAHYGLTSSLMHGTFWSGIPQPWISGLELKPGEKLRMGGVAWVFPAVGSKANMLEVGAQGFPALEKALDRIEDQAVIIGSRLLEVHLPGGQEGASTAAIHFSGEHSVLASVGQTISEGVTQALKTFVAWTGNDPSSTSCVLNNDFFNTPMDPTERLSIIKGWQSGAISDETKFGLLQAKGDIPADITFEAEQARIKASTGLDSVAAPVAAPSIPDQPLTDQLNPTVQTP